MTQSGHVTFVLGGARSGKSVFAESLAIQTGLERHYLATCEAYDDEMRARVARHRMDRGEGWQTHEIPLLLTERLKSLDGGRNVVLVDCLTLWVTNLMMAEADIEAEFSALIDHLADVAGHVILVSNEVGLGIVPDNAMARAFRDHAGRLHQAVARVADEVIFIAAGLPLKMKG